MYLAAILDKLGALEDILAPQRPQETEVEFVALVEPKSPPKPKRKRRRPKKKTA